MTGQAHGQHLDRDHNAFATDEGEANRQFWTATINPKEPT